MRWLRASEVPSANQFTCNENDDVTMRVPLALDDRSLPLSKWLKQPMGQIYQLVDGVAETKSRWAHRVVDSMAFKSVEDIVSAK